MQEEASSPDALVCLDSMGQLGMSSVLHLWEELISCKIQNKAQMLLSSLTGALLHGRQCAKPLVGEEGEKRRVRHVSDF